MQLLYELHVVCSHDSYQLLKACLLRVPAQQGFGFGGIAQQLLHFGRAEIFGIYLNQHFTGSGVDAFFFYFFIFFSLLFVYFFII